MSLDLTSPAQLTDLLQRHNFRIKKRFGQNFLVDRNILNKIVDSLELKEGDSVLEIGPGVGTLTQALAERGVRVVAVEVDRDLITILSELLADSQNVCLVNEDFLSLNLPEFLTEHFGEARVKVVGNLPYYITSPIIAELLQVRERLDRIVLMIQREVAERLRASPGTRDYGSMSVFVQFYCKFELVAYVSKNVFLPPPEVSSAIVRLLPLCRPPVEVPSEDLFFDVVHCAFGQRRKTLLNSLADCPELDLSKEQIARILHQAHVEPSRRAETLSLEEFASISRAISNACW